MNQQIAEVIQKLIAGEVTQADAQHRIGRLLMGIGEYQTEVIPDSGSRGEAIVLIQTFTRESVDPATGLAQFDLTLVPESRDMFKYHLGAGTDTGLGTSLQEVEETMSDSFADAADVPAARWSTSPEAAATMPEAMFDLPQRDIYSAYLGGLRGMPIAAERYAERLQPRAQAQFELQDPYRENVETGAGLMPAFMSYLTGGKGPLQGQNLLNALRSVSSALSPMGAAAQNKSLAEQTADLIRAGGTAGEAARVAGARRTRYGQDEAGQRRQFQAAMLPYSQAGYNPDTVGMMGNILEAGYNRARMTNPFLQFLPYAMSADPNIFSQTAKWTQ